MENKQCHLQMIQVIISRMANNLFFLKGWAITLIAALFAISAKEQNWKYFLIAYVPVFVFWILDGYFLSQERLFRNLYDDVRMLEEERINFSMDTSAYRLNRRNSWAASLLSWTLLWFYIPLIILMLFIMYWLNK